MVPSLRCNMKGVKLDKYEALPGPVADNPLGSTRRVEDLLELQPADTAPIFEVSPPAKNVAHYVRFSARTGTVHFYQTYTVYWELVCTRAFSFMIGIPCRHRYEKVINISFLGHLIQARFPLILRK